MHAGSRRCYTEPGFRQQKRIGSVVLGWYELDTAGWCGQNGSFSGDGNVYTRRWAAAPYCFENENVFDRWLTYPTKRQIGGDISAGSKAPWGCVTYFSFRSRMNLGADGGARAFVG